MHVLVPNTLLYMRFDARIFGNVASHGHVYRVLLVVGADSSQSDLPLSAVRQRVRHERRVALGAQHRFRQQHFYVSLLLLLLLSDDEDEEESASTASGASRSSAV